MVLIKYLVIASVFVILGVSYFLNYIDQNGTQNNNEHTATKEEIDNTTQKRQANNTSKTEYINENEMFQEKQTTTKPDGNTKNKNENVVSESNTNKKEPIKHRSLIRESKKEKPKETKTVSTQQNIKTTINKQQKPKIIQTPKEPSYYSFPKSSLDEINTLARKSIVNLLCVPNNNTLNPISGSGVIIDPRGIILTNAHVAQYFLLSQDNRVNIDCAVRYGSPARSKWKASVLYFPTSWINEHAKDINKQHPTGTGENDWALLLITKEVNGSGIGVLPNINIETREGLVKTGDKSIVAGYPAGFIGGISAQKNLFSASAVATLGAVYTFHTNVVDLVSLGGIILAQGGSSGGAVVNEWGKLIGMVVTSSNAPTTGERDLRAITLAHVNRSLYKETGKFLMELLTGDIITFAKNFQTNTAPLLIQQLIDAISM